MQGSAPSSMAILVQGMNASGTSLLSRLTALVLQAWRGEPASLASSLDFRLFMSTAIAGVNRRILQDLGSAWNKSSVLFLRGKSIADSAPLIRDSIRKRYRELALSILRSAPGGEAVILEDPASACYTICGKPCCWRQIMSCARSMFIAIRWK